MGDDPYDFEIAIPSGGATRSGGGGGGGSAKNFGSRHYGSDSSDGSDVSVSNSDESDHDDDHDDEEEDSPVKAITKHHTQSTVVTRSTASTGGGGGSSALDKAKSFLSKYSTKSVDTKQSKPQASRRLELSLDDSMDFSSDEDEDDGSSARKQKEETASSAKTAVKSTTKVASAPIKRVQLSDSEDYGIDSDDEKSHKAALQGIRGVEKEESESDDADSARGSHGYRSDQHQETVVTPASIPSRSTTAVAATPRAVESSVGEDYDEEDEEIASFMDESDEGDPPPFTATVPSRAPISDAVKSGVPSSVLEASKPHSAVQYTNLEKSDEHEESIASKSDYVESFEDEEPPSSKPVVAATAKQVVAASESGVYEDEAFDEESGVVPASVQASNQPPISQLGGSSRAFDYSMDFSDDNVVEGKLETPPRAAAAAHSIPVMQTEAVREQASAPPSPANSHESDRQEQSDYLESDEDRSVIARDLEAPSGDEKLALSASHSSESAVIDVYKNSVAPVTIHSDTEVASRTDVVWLEPDTVRDQKSQGSLAPSAVQQESLTETVSRTIPSDQQSKAPVACGPPLHTVAPTTVTTRGRVLIVREYEQPARESVEMKDASTQFTGNHAGIQADLTPDGMHSLHSSSAPEAPTPPSLPEHRTSGAATDHGKSACDPSPAPAVPPSPPPAPMLGSPGYSMDLLRLPTAVTTSIYKQQLLALQEQILTKKRETERLVQERMTFQYSSLRGTERFLASNRPGKLELWQALMRVDPTLTEHKAREIARLTAENAAA